MINLDSILKSTDMTLPTKVHLVKAMVFSVVKFGCESWTIKKAECWRIDAFELWCWRRLLRVPWTARRSNQSILKEIRPEYSSEGLMLKLKLQYFGHLMRRADSIEKTLMLGKIEGERRRDNRRWDGWMASPTQRTWVWVSSGGWWWTGSLGMLQSMGLQRVGHDWATNWTELSQRQIPYYFSYLWNLENKSNKSEIYLWRQGTNRWLPEGRVLVVWEKWVKGIKRYKLLVIMSQGLITFMVTDVC